METNPSVWKATYAVCAEVGGWAGHPEEQQREAHQRAPGVNLQCGGVETSAPFIQGITEYPTLTIPEDKMRFSV